MALTVCCLNIDVVRFKACDAQASDIKQLTEKRYGPIFRVGEYVYVRPMSGRDPVDFIGRIVRCRVVEQFARNPSPPLPIG